jgi:hypothetical protein
MKRQFGLIGCTGKVIAQLRFADKIAYFYRFGAGSAGIAAIPCADRPFLQHKGI